MRFYKKLNIHRNSTGTNVFDGYQGRSYKWFVYAQVMSNNDVIMCENSYSNSTAKHMSEFRSMIGYKVAAYILAPNGLGNTASARTAINAEIAKLEAELTNKRNRDVAGRKARIAKLQAMLPVLDRLERDNAGQSEAA